MEMSSMPMRSQREVIGWLLFFILSLLIHILALLFWPAHSLALAEHPSETSLAVTLSTAPEAVATSLPDTAAKKRPHQYHAPIAQPSPPQQSSPPQPEAATNVAAEAVPDSVAEPQSPLTNDNATSITLQQRAAVNPHAESIDTTSDTISAQIRTRFSDHFVYPLLAQRNGWEGEVVLGFRVANDGTLSDIQIIQSSGYPLLDEAALSSMRAIGKIEFSSGAILHRTLELRMPVVYHLAQG